ncbi:MAG: TonB-dependent receptor [Ideonella sp.]|nr:TonB-dependent receptor [Ideonella sp.]
MVEVMRDGAMVVRVPADKGPGASLGTSPGAPGAVGVAQASSSAASGESDPGRRQGGPAESGVAHQLETMEVTGSRLRRIESEGPLPVNVYRREDIDRSGQPTLERFLSSLNETSVSAGEGMYGGQQGQGTVQLRGLPLGSTLVLINGRRVQAVGSSSGNFFNLNLIPMAAVERVEIVPVGSSAVYGGDALAGVVNVILRKAADGQSLDSRLSVGKGFEDGSVALVTGAQGESGSFLLLGSFGKATALSMSERDFFRDTDYRRFGGVDARSMTCTPGTVTSSTAANLPGLGSRTAAIPALASGQTPTVASFAATAGQPRLCSDLSGFGYALSNARETIGIHASGDRQINRAWSVFGEFTYADDRSATPYGGFALSNVLVPATNPYNPFGTAVRVTSLLAPENGRRGAELKTRFGRVLLGVRGELPGGWDVEATASTSRDDGDRVGYAQDVNATARTAALASTDPATALNPFATGRAASEGVIRSIWTDNVRQNHGRRDQVGVFARGTLARLPAGPLDAIIGGEVARDRYETSLPGTSIENGRRFHAVYGELRVPLARADGGGGRGAELAALTLAGRRDDYSDFGAAGTYQAGLEVRPTRTWLLRASAATSFKPPTLLQTEVDPVSFTSEFFGLVDPARGNARVVGAEVIRTTNTDLMPEKGKAFALGTSWEPAAGTRLGATAWQLKVNGLIALPAPQALLDNEALFPGVVTRGATVNGVPGAVTRVRFAEVNFGRVETRGIDLDASYAWSSSAGRWTAAASATRMSAYDVAITPGAAAVSRLGRRYTDYWAPRWKGRMSLGLDARAWGVGLTGRYLGPYQDAGTTDRRLGNHLVWDLAARLDLKKFGAALDRVRTASLSLGLVNLANRMPEYVSSPPYYDWTQADWRGRTASVRLSVDW